MLFWVIIILCATAIGAMLGQTLMRGRVGNAPPAAYDLQVYQDQLKEVDRDLARGLLSPEDAERVRIEVSRRILKADAQLHQGGDHGGQPPSLSRVTAIGLALMLVIGAVSLYSTIGAPGTSGLPRKARIAASDAARQARLSQQDAEARVPASVPVENATDEFLAIMEQLRETVKQRPDDLRGLRLLIKNEATIGNLVAARQAQEQLIAVSGDNVTAAEYAHLAELMISAAGGYVSSDAETVLRKALNLSPVEPRARYYLGIYLMQVDRPDSAFRIWRNLLEESHPDAPWVTVIRTQIQELAWRAGVDYTLPSIGIPAPGPTAEDIKAISELDDVARQELIQGMVARLAERLSTDGGSPRDWARLIEVYNTLGETAKAQSTWDAAKTLYADYKDALSFIRKAAEKAGLAL